MTLQYKIEESTYIYLLTNYYNILLGPCFYLFNFVEFILEKENLMKRTLIR